MRQSEKDIVKPDRLQMTKQRVFVACCKTKATDTLSEYVPIISFRWQQ